MFIGIHLFSPFFVQTFEEPVKEKFQMSSVSKRCSFSSGMGGRGEREGVREERLETQLALDGVIRVVVGCQVSV